MEALDCLNLLSYKQTNKQITYLGGNSTTEDVHNAIVIEKIPKIPNIPKNPNEANGIIKEEDPENEGSLSRGIGNCLGVALSIVQVG